MNTVVIGAVFGDEGKGYTVDFVSPPNSVVIRFSGGQQAGHTAHRSGVSHVFSNFGSGTLKKLPTFWSRYCTVDPPAILNELEILISKGLDPVLYIDEDCPVTTPFDKFDNQKKDYANGTCGTGFGSTLAREEKFFSIRAGDLKFPSVMMFKMDAVSKYYGYVGSENVHVRDFFVACVELLKTGNIEIVNEKEFLQRKGISGMSKVFEGSQGIMLDQNIGFFPHVTRSNTDSTNVLKLINDDEVIDELFIVTRAYQTRHGNGPMTNSDLPSPVLLYDRETNVSNRFQGDFRKTVLDIDLLKYAISREAGMRSGRVVNVNLMVTCVHHLSVFQFTHNGKLHEFQNPYEFVIEISKRLPVNFRNVYAGMSDTADGVEHVVSNRKYFEREFSI